MQKQEIKPEKKTKFSDKQTKKINLELNKYLGPELISYRTGMGGVKLAYTEGWTIVNIANKIFGFEGWNSEVIALETDFLDEKKIQGIDRYSVGISCRMRITLKDGTKREDVGYGMMDNAKSKGLALEKAKKEAVTDAMKRTFRLFGNAMGNCLYDKEYLTNVKKIMKEDRINVTDTQLFRRSNTKVDKLKDISEDFSFDSAELTHL